VCVVYSYGALKLSIKDNYISEKQEAA